MSLVGLALTCNPLPVLSQLWAVCMLLALLTAYSCLTNVSVTADCVMAVQADWVLTVQVGCVMTVQADYVMTVQAEVPSDTGQGL